MTGPAAISLQYRLDEAVSLIAAPSFRHIERWTVTVRADDPVATGRTRSIGDARVIVLNLEPDMTPADLADQAAGDWVERSWTTEHAESTTIWAAAGRPVESSVLILDRVWIDPAWRGNGLGPVVAACAIARLGRGCRLAACYPAPLDSQQNTDDRERSISALSRIWAKVGFTPWNDGVWMLDLQSDTARQSLQQLLPRPTSHDKETR
jgi:hypothetical protein